MSLFLLIYFIGMLSHALTYRNLSQITGNEVPLPMTIGTLVWPIITSWMLANAIEAIFTRRGTDNGQD